jgi:hypothetical protein
LKQLTEELSITPADPEEQEEEKEWAAVIELRTIAAQLAEEERKRKEALNLSDDEDDATTRNNFEFTMRQRRVHYKKKLFALDEKIKSLKKERMDIDANRTKYTLDMRAKEKMLLACKLEVERLRQYTGTTVTSSVLAGFNMQYNTSDYTRRIEKTYETVLQEIGTIKFAVITGENRRNKTKEELEATERSKLERTAKYHEFEKQYQRQKRMLSKFAQKDKSDEELYTLYFRNLANFVVERKSLRRKITDTFLHLIQR